MVRLNTTAWLAAGLFGVVMSATPGSATTIADPAGDFLASYTGPLNADVDILSATAVRDTTGVRLSATVDGDIGTAGALYVWGINRGAGTARLSFGSPSVGAGVLFDALFVMFSNGDSRVVTFPSVGAPTILVFPSSLEISGGQISGFVPFNLLPSTGFAPADYQYALWSRQRVNPAMDGPNSEIADFAPDVASFTASVPEASTWAMLIAGFAAVGAAARRRKVAATMA